MLAALIALTVVAFGTSGNGIASPAPQATIVTAPFGRTVPLGDLKIKVEDLRAATAADNPHHLPMSADENLLVMHVVLSNSVLPSYSGVVTYRLEDKDGYGPRTWERLSNIQQRTTVNLTGLFTVDKGYVATSILVECSSCKANHYTAVQFTVPAQSASPSPSPGSSQSNQAANALSDGVQVVVGVQDPV